MNITITKLKLLTAIRAIEHSITKNTSLPILGTILLKTDNGKLCLTTTNLELGIRYWIGAKIEREGSIALPARVFSEFIGSIKDEKINITAEKNILTITTEHTKTQILGMKTEEFPIIPVVKSESQINIPSKKIFHALSGVQEASAVLETRPELNGVYVQATHNEVIFAATDSFRLAEYSIPTKTNIEKSFILPRNTATEITRLACDREEDIVFRISDNQIAAHGSDFELVSRLVDGRYPEYKKIIPEKFASSVVVSKSELEHSVRTASIFSSNISDLTLKATSNALQITARNSDKGEIISDIPIANNKTQFSVTLNYRYLLDGIKAVNSGRVVLGYTGEGSPFAVQGEGESHYVYVIMPLRTP